MAQSVLTITHNETSADIIELTQPQAGNLLAASAKFVNYFAALGSGNRAATVLHSAAAVKASGTITWSGTGAANDTILINGVTFTAKASGATGNEWNVGASATLSAAAAAAAINASATALVANNVTASAASGVLTITAVYPGTTGNCITIAEGVDGSSHMTVSGARLTAGTNGTQVTYSFGV